MTTVLLCLLLVTVMCSSVPSAQAEEATIQDKTVSILNDLAGLNTTAYTSSAKPQQQDSFMTMPRQTADLILSSSQGQLRARCSFIDNRLHQIFITDVTGEVSLNSKAANIAEDAKDFLQRYQNYTTDAFYGNLQSMLDTVNFNQNASKTAGNVKLDVTAFSQSRTNFVWTYVDANGVKAPVKNVALTYQDGTLKCFTDNWQFYTVASAPAISKEQAVDYALNISAGYSLTATASSGENVTVSDFKVESVGEAALCYLNFHEAGSARDGDPFTLYPSWYVPLGFDRAYFGGVTGIYVRFWADTGEICDISPMVVRDAAVFTNESDVDVSSSDVPTQEPDAVLTAVPVVLVIIFGLVSFYFSGNKSRFYRLKCAQKLSLKLYAGLLCGLMLAGLVFTSAPRAQALSPGSAGSVIYASTHEQYNGTTFVNGTAPFNGYYFNGTHFVYYATYNEPSAAQNVTNMLKYLFDNADYDDTFNNYGPYTTRDYILWFTYNMERYYDNIAVFYFGHMHGNDSYWCGSGPYNSTFYESHVNASEIFGLTLGKTKFAWSWVCKSAISQTSGLPVAWSHGQLNDSYHCYIGFDGASPSLSAVSFNETAGLGMTFIPLFYYYALDQGMTVSNALNMASWDTFGECYDNSPLADGFKTYWPKQIGDPEKAAKTGWYSGFMRVYGNAYIKLLPQRYLSISCNSTQGYTSTSSGYYEHGTEVYVTAYAYAGYDFNHWILDGYSYYNENPIKVTMNGDRNLQAVFVDEDAGYWLTVDACGNYHPYLPAPVSIDGGAWTGVAGDSFWVPEGYHSVEVPQYGYYQGVYYQFYTFYGYSGENPLYILVDYDKEVNALYWGSY